MNVISTIYTNRCDPYVVNRTLSNYYTETQKTNKRKIHELQDKISTLVHSIDTETHDSSIIQISDLVANNKRRRKISKLKTIAKLLTPEHFEKMWHQRTMSFKKIELKDISRLIISSTIMDRKPEIFHDDPDMCTTCNQLYVFDSIRSINTCTQCGKSNRVLFVSEDISQDMLVTKDPTSIGTQTRFKTKQQYTYTRSPLYRRYLSQFSESRPSIPLSVMKILYTYLSNIHFQTSVRCRPTPVNNVLRSHGLTHWGKYAVLISKTFNGEAIPSIPDTLIDRLVERFDYIFTTASQRKEKSKIPSFEFLTHILLYMEGRKDLAMSFAIHKTKKVLHNTYTTFLDLLPNVAKLASHLQWNNTPLF